MKLKFDVEIMEMDDASVAVPVGDGAEAFHGVLKLNESGAFILRLLQNETTEEAIVDAILKEYSGDREQITKYVHDYVGTLQQAGLLA